MTDLPMDRVREIAEWFDTDYAEDHICNAAGDGHGITEGEVTALARMVLALTAQRDEAVAVAREAIDGWMTADPYSRDDDFTKPLRAKLAALRAHPDYQEGR